MPRVITESGLPLLCPCRVSVILLTIAPLHYVHQTVLVVTRLLRSSNHQRKRERFTSFGCLTTGLRSRRHDVASIQGYPPQKVRTDVLLFMHASCYNTHFCVTGSPWVTVKRNICLQRDTWYHLTPFFATGLVLPRTRFARQTSGFQYV